jgi:large subunit ribosomal protein L29
MKAADLREKTVTDLQELRASLAHDVFQNRLKNFTNRLDDTSTIRKTRRDLARVLTLLRAQAHGAAVAPAAEPVAPAAKTKAKAPPAAKVKAKTTKTAEAPAPAAVEGAAEPVKAKKSAKKSAGKSEAK